MPSWYLNRRSGMKTKIERTVKATVVLEGTEVDFLIILLSRARGSAPLMEFAQKLIRELQESEADSREEES